MMDYFLGSVLLAIGHVVCFQSMVERRYSQKKNLLIYLGAGLVFILITCLSAQLFWEERRAGVSVAYMATACLWYVVFFRTSADPLCKKVFLFFNYGCLFCILTSISIMLVHGPFPEIADGKADILKGFLEAFLSVLVSLAYRKWLRPTVRALSGSQKKTWYAIALVSVLFLIPFTAFLLSCRTYFRRPNYLLAFALLLMLYFGVLWVLFRVILYMQDEARNDLVRLNIEYLQGQMEQASQKELLAKTIRHDYRHHCHNIAAMLEAGKQEEALGYIRQYVERMEETRPRSFCAHMTVNAILNHFSEQAAQNGIAFTAAADTPQDSSISDLDYVALLSNLLENACSGCVERGEGGFVRLDLRTVGRKTVIVCRNSCREDLEIRDNMLVKRDVGVESILATTRKYHGDIRYEMEDGALTVCVILNG